jgi:uncharacterized protein YkwD
MLIQLTRIFPILWCLLFIDRSNSNSFSPLSKFSSEWNDSRYLKCNTASGTAYMSAKEKEVIYILNLLRANPRLFANTVVKKYPEYSHNDNLRKVSEYKSLLKTLQKSEPLPLLNPDALCYASAECHAASAGRRGYIGHDRKEATCRAKQHFNGECCEYGHNDALDILMTLLIDQNVPSLPHRQICLSAYKTLGVSIQPHKSFRYNSVLDFSF